MADAYTWWVILDRVELDAFVRRVEVFVCDAEAAGGRDVVGCEVVADVRRAAHGRRDLRVVMDARGAEHGFDERGPIGKSIYVAFLGMF